MFYILRGQLIFTLKMGIAFANNADPDERPQSAAFHNLGLRGLQMYLLWGSGLQRVNTCWVVMKLFEHEATRLRVETSSEGQATVNVIKQTCVHHYSCILHDSTNPNRTGNATKVAFFLHWISYIVKPV